MIRISPETIYDAWAPAHSRWSDWAKPTVFAAMPSAVHEQMRRMRVPQLAPRELPPARGDVALVIDLPSERSVDLGAAMALTGYQPVPLYNGLPAPGSHRGVLDLLPITTALAGYSDDLAALRLPDEAPPAFLLDAARLGTTRSPMPGSFDNRWVVFPQDLPSGGLLLARGIQRVVHLHAPRTLCGSDLEQVFARWQKAGLAVEQFPYGQRDAVVTPFTARRLRHGLLRWLGWGLVGLGLRRSAAGGFGSLVPMPSQGGSRYG